MAKNSYREWEQFPLADSPPLEEGPPVTLGKLLEELDTTEGNQPKRKEERKRQG